MVLPLTEIYNGTAAVADGLPKMCCVSACVILFNSVAGEVWSYGDCQCRIGEELHYEEKEVDRRLSELRAFVIMSVMREQEKIVICRCIKRADYN